MSTPSGQSYSAKLSPQLLDSGKRASDIINVFITGLPFEDIKNKYVAIRLADGGSDGILYDTKQDAVRHQYHEQQCAYVCMRNLAGGANPREMAIYLKFNRDAYYAGFRLVDPDAQDGGKEVLPTAAQGDFYQGRMQR